MEVWVFLDLARDYQLDRLPCHGAGSLLYREGATEERQYLVWLAEYLHGAVFTIGDWQRELCLRLRDAPDRSSAVKALGMNAAWHVDDVFDVEVIVDEVVDETICCLEAQVRLVLAELEARERSSPEEEAEGWDSELTLADIRLVLAERADRRAHFGEDGDTLEEYFPDLGWRVPLATIIRCEPDPEQRVALLRIFFEAFRTAYGR
jgi:hypothetical protein